LRTLVPDADTDARLDDVLLMASELVTNALEYTSGSVAVSAWRTTRAEWRVEVTDESSTRLPVPRRAPDTSMCGRGLFIVHTLATQWGSKLIPGGKCSWFVVCP
jgi:two-component sensor histidine kinase